MPTTDTLVITDAGLETWLIFEHGVDLPAFAAYPLAGDPAGRQLLTDYYEAFADIAERTGAGVLLEAPTWRANPDWAALLGHDRATLADLIRRSVDVVASVREGRGSTPFLIGGAIGPRGDGYRTDALMDAGEAERYHRFQIDVMAQTAVDTATAFTIGYTDEAIGIAAAARAAALPVVIGFTVETDGSLPSGEKLGDAIDATDAATDGYPTHYMINCAHPTHFDHAVGGREPWTARIGAVRANASMMSHAELDEATALDDGDPADLAARCAALRAALPSLHVIGGCCGTDHRHVDALATAFAQ
jgi:S-methylmethionine-dependent homocysteine/selenocysteine methylase